MKAKRDLSQYIIAALLVGAPFLFAQAQPLEPQADEQGFPGVTSQEATNKASHSSNNSESATNDNDKSVEPVKIDVRKLQDELLLAIENVEGESGPFDVGLSEPLESLADLLGEEGEHEEALEIYARLLHINRINQGLYNDNQFSIIDKIFEGSLASNNWTAADNAREYKYFLSQRLYAEDDTALLNQLNQFMDWKLTYIGMDSRRNKSQHLVALKDLAETAVEIGEAQLSEDKIALAKAYYRRAMIHYYYVVAIDHSDTTGRELARRKSLSAARIGSDPVLSNLETFPQIRFEFGKGKKLLEQIRESFDTDAEKEQKAMASLYLGDWNLLTDKRGQALKSYQQAYSLFLDMGMDEKTVNHFFSRPVAIPLGQPTFTLKDFAETSPGDPQAVTGASSEQQKNDPERSDAVEKLGSVRLADYYAWSKTLPSISFPVLDTNRVSSYPLENFLEVEMKIKVAAKKLATPSPQSSFRSINRNGKGNVENVKVIEANTSNDKTRWEALDDIDRLMFRPKLVDGEAVDVENARMKYLFAIDQ